MQKKMQELPMWLTLLKVHYDDFTLENCDIQSYHQLFHQFKENIVIEIKNISDLVTAGQIPNTQEQGNSDTWHNARWCCITASISKTVTKLGETLFTKDKIQKSQLFKFCEDKLWFPQNITTLDMLYGIKEEPKARTSYNKVTGSVVQESGLWVNVIYPWLGASPDGLILNLENVIGLIEIKCLKIFRTRTVEAVVDQHNKKLLKISGQCFKIENRKIVLKKSHDYYYQVQHQLLVTGLKFCDFVLHTPLGKPSIERIYPDEKLQEDIKNYTLAFWEKVMIPEYFIMRVPRNLLPLVF